jgi:hypothetical protein
MNCNQVQHEPALPDPMPMIALQSGVLANNATTLVLTQL